MVRRIVYQGTGKIMVAVSNPAWRSVACTELWLLSKTAETIFPFGVLHATARQTARVPHHLLSHTSRSLHRYPKNFVWLQPKWKCVANLCGWCHGLFQQVKPRSCRLVSFDTWTMILAIANADSSRTKLCLIHRHGPTDTLTLTH